MADVALTFDFDAMSLWIGSYRQTDLGVVSRGEFAPTGVGRVLALLERHEVRATFFVPGHTALTYPDCVRAIVAGGHEVGHHGFVHERLSELSPDRELAVLKRGIEVLENVAGARPVGYRSPSWEMTAETVRLLTEHGFLYDSSLMGSDFHPYWLRSGDRLHAEEAYHFGAQVPVVEIPVSWLLDDFPHFEYVPRGAGPSAMKPPSQVYEIWWEEFDYFHSLQQGGCFTLTMHPEVIGRGSRLRMLDELVGAMRQRSGVRFAPLAEVAQAWRAAQPRRSSAAGEGHGR